jgi:hypothetical protein
MKLEKFDLEKALNGTKVFTRDGLEVTQLTKFDTYEKYCLYGVVNDEIICWDIKGRYCGGTTPNMDLYIEGEVQSVWVNIYKSDKQNLLVSGTYKTKETAISCIIPNIYQYIKTIEITDEP